MASLINLTHLHIKVHQSEAEALHGLGKLPNLVLLNLSSETSGALERCIITKGYFQCLKVFSYKCRRCGMGLQFEPGAMPQLQRLWISFKPLQIMSGYGSFDFGIQYLSRLSSIRTTINFWRATASDVVEAAYAAIREQVSLNPNSPLLELSIEKGDDMEMDDGA